MWNTVVILYDFLNIYFADKAGNQKPKTEPQQPSQTHAVDSNTMYSVDIGNLVLKIYQGDITAVKVDVIINGTNIDLDLTKGR